MLPKAPEPQAPHLAYWKTIVETICTMEILVSTQIHDTNTWFRELDRIGWDSQFHCQIATKACG